jgi:EpsI family protein
MTSETGSAERLVPPTTLGDWPQTAAANVNPWNPGMIAGDETVRASYAANADHNVDLAVVVFHAQHAGRHAAVGGNTSTDGEGWQEVSRSSSEVTIAGKRVQGNWALLRSGTRERLVLMWYESGDCVTGSRLMARLCAARTRMTGKPAPGAFFALSTNDPITSDTPAKSILTEAAARLKINALMAQNGHASSG